MSRFALPGVERTGHGTARAISALGIYHIALVARLVEALGIGLEPAASLAITLLATADGSNLTVFDGLTLRFDRIAFTTRIDAQIADAVEWVNPPRRGRPRGHRSAAGPTELPALAIKSDEASLRERRPI